MNWQALHHTKNVLYVLTPKGDFLQVSFRFFPVVEIFRQQKKITLSLAEINKQTDSFITYRVCRLFVGYLSFRLISLTLLTSKYPQKFLFTPQRNKSVVSLLSFFPPLCTVGSHVTQSEAKKFWKKKVLLSALFRGRLNYSHISSSY